MPNTITPLSTKAVCYEFAIGIYTPPWDILGLNLTHHIIEYNHMRDGALEASKYQSLHQQPSTT